MDCEIPVKATGIRQFYQIFPVDGLQNSSSFYRNFAVHLPENPVKRKFLKRHRVGIELGPAAWVADTLATSHMILI